MSALARIARIAGVLFAALLVTLVSAGAVLWATAPPPPTLPADFAVPAPSAPVSQPAVRAELLRRYTLDQAVREAADLDALSDLTVGGAWSLAQSTVTMLGVDRPNQAWVRQIVADGWPGADAVGRDGMEALFFLVQHAGPDLQRQALGPFRAAWRAGALDGQQVALLTDRIRVGEGRRQLYGTQIALSLDGLVVAPIENAATVDARRAEMGMPPLADYLDVTCREAGMCASRPS